MADAQSPMNEHPSLKVEAHEAIKDISFAIHKATVTDDSCETTAYIHLTTKEMEDFFIHLTVQGYKIIKGKSEGMYFETIQALLNQVSSSFPSSFAQAVTEKLLKIQKNDST